MCIEVIYNAGICGHKCRVDTEKCSVARYDTVTGIKERKSTSVDYCKDCMTERNERMRDILSWSDEEVKDKLDTKDEKRYDLFGSMMLEAISKWDIGKVDENIYQNKQHGHIFENVRPKVQDRLAKELTNEGIIGIYREPCETGYLGAYSDNQGNFYLAVHYDTKFGWARSRTVQDPQSPLENDIAMWFMLKAQTKVNFKREPVHGKAPWPISSLQAKDIKGKGKEPEQ
ncbi:hypothetical protein B0O99DRAFT_683618 [Bisporella sp. PMI_857]|nr:hypothetical protein B0O99DRAFT_683618 [Bisporella sp. PMI_857]